jgi:ATP-dependent DNA helicase DinG
MNSNLNELKYEFRKFRGLDFRQGQKEAIDFILESKKKVSILCAPTGSGKSLIGMCCMAHFQNPVYLCSSRQLQTQLTHDFPEAEIMWGRSHFECDLIPSRTADKCIHSPSRFKCKYKNPKDLQCDYERQKLRVLPSAFPILNYHYFLTESNYIGRFSNRDLVICDEADTLESILAGFINLTFPRSAFDRLKLKPPEFITASSKRGVETWVKWAEDTESRINKHVESLGFKLFKLESESDEYMRFSKIQERYIQLKQKLQVFKKHVDPTWLYEEVKDQYGEVKSYEFKPTWLSNELCQNFLWKHGSKFVFMSATFPPIQVISKIFGISIDDIDWMELPSSFPIDNRKIILIPSGDLAYKTFDRDIKGVIDAIKTILDKHPNDKGLIHSVSYKLTKLIMDIDNDRLITHNASNKMEVLNGYIQSDKPLVFVSPSSTRGLDLPDNKCRFVIIAKAPYLSLADKLTKARVYSSNIGQHWYTSDAAQEIVQSTGRAVRSKDDWAITYILDIQAYNKIINSQSLFPKYYLEAVEIL